MKMNMTFLSLALLLVPAAMVAMDERTSSPTSALGTLATLESTRTTDDEDAKKLELRLGGFETSLLAITRQLNALTTKLDGVAPKPAPAASAAAASTPTGIRHFKLHADGQILYGLGAGLVVAAILGGSESARELVRGLAPDARLLLAGAGAVAGTALTTRFVDDKGWRRPTVSQVAGFGSAAFTSASLAAAVLAAGSRTATRLGRLN